MISLQYAVYYYNNDFSAKKKACDKLRGNDYIERHQLRVKYTSSNQNGTSKQHNECTERKRYKEYEEILDRQSRVEQDARTSAQKQISPENTIDQGHRAESNNRDQPGKAFQSINAILDSNQGSSRSQAPGQEISVGEVIIRREEPRIEVPPAEFALLPNREPYVNVEDGLPRNGSGDISPQRLNAAREFMQEILTSKSYILKMALTTIVIYIIIIIVVGIRSVFFPGEEECCYGFRMDSNCESVTGEIAKGLDFTSIYRSELSSSAPPFLILHALGYY